VGTTASAAMLRAFEGLITVAYLLRILGVETFGIWALISTCAVYLFILDLGVVGSLGRLFAGCRDADDIDKLNRVASTALTLLLAVGIITIVAAIAMAKLFPLIFHVPDFQVHDVQTALLIAGCGVAVYFSMQIFGIVLWSYERFDLINAIEMLMSIARLCLVLSLLHEGSSLTLLASIGFATNVTAALLSAAFAWWVEPRFRPLPGYVSRGIVREIYSIGVWFSALTIARSLTQQVGPTLVGHGLGNRVMATFTISRQLTTYVSMVMLSLTQIAAPRAAVLFFGQHKDEQRVLFVSGGRAAIAMAFFFVGGFLCLGRPFISLWQEGRQDEAFAPLVILLLGEALPMGQGITYSILTAMGRHRYLAKFAIAEGLVTLLLAAIAIKFFGMTGVCIVIATSSFLFRGLCPWLHACRLLDVMPIAYIREAVIPVAAAWFISIACLLLLISNSPPDGWLSLILYGTLYAAVYSIACSFVLGREILIPIRNLILRNMGIV